MEPLIRERAAMILDSLPIGVEFDWVDKVSKELTGMTLATLFGMPQEDRRKLIYWSDVVTAAPGQGLIDPNTGLPTINQFESSARMEAVAVSAAER